MRNIIILSLAIFGTGVCGAIVLDDFEDGISAWGCNSWLDGSNVYLNEYCSAPQGTLALQVGYNNASGTGWVCHGFAFCEISDSFWFLSFFDTLFIYSKGDPEHPPVFCFLEEDGDLWGTEIMQTTFDWEYHRIPLNSDEFNLRKG